MMEGSNVHRRLEPETLADVQGAQNYGNACGAQASIDKVQRPNDGRVGPHALHLAAQAWCQSGTSHKVMDPDLCVAFASILERELRKPWLGNATTAELLDEVHARCGSLQYATAGR